MLERQKDSLSEQQTQEQEIFWSEDEQDDFEKIDESKMKNAKNYCKRWELKIRKT